MKPKILQLLTVLFFTGPLFAEEFRDWRDEKGRTVSAALVDANDEVALLRLKNNTQSKFPILSLSQSDQKFIKKWKEEQAELRKHFGLELFQQKRYSSKEGKFKTGGAIATGVNDNIDYLIFSSDTMDAFEVTFKLTPPKESGGNSAVNLKDLVVNLSGSRGTWSNEPSPRWMKGDRTKFGTFETVEPKGIGETEFSVIFWVPSDAKILGIEYRGTPKRKLSLNRK